MLKKYICISLILLLTSLSGCDVITVSGEKSSEKASAENNSWSSSEAAEKKEEKIYVGIINEYIESTEGQIWVTTGLSGENKKVRFAFSEFADDISASDDALLLFKREAIKSGVTVTYRNAVEDEEFITLKGITDLKLMLYDHYGAMGITDPEIIGIYRTSHAYLEVDLDGAALEDVSLKTEVAKDSEGNTVINWTVDNNGVESLKLDSDLYLAITDPAFGEGKWHVMGILKNSSEQEVFSERDSVVLAPGEQLSGAGEFGKMQGVTVRAFIPVFKESGVYFVYTEISADSFR